MGRATRWLKSLFGIKRDKGQKEINPNSGSQRENKWTGMGHSGRDTADGLCSNPNTIPPNITPAEAAWLRSFYADSGDKEQSKHAIAVAAATAAAADAAVAAAQAAVAVVRLTSQGRGGTMFGGGGGGGGSREKWAVTKIQSVFRGFLARKALRALKGLVKLQALVRGYLVRKQAFATFHSMQALIRAQANVRAQKTRGLLDSTAASSNRQFHAANSAEKFDEGRSRQNSFHNRRLSASFDSINSNAIDEIPKIVEIDTGRPKSRSRRSCGWVSDSISGDAQTLSSSCQCRHPPPHLSIPDCRNSQDSDWGLTGDECRFSTPQSTPRFSNSCGTNPPVTPAKSVCVESLFRNCPNYMANTQSFKAKLRSYSAPKQRPEPGSKRRLSLNEMMESRSSLSGVRMQRSCSQVQEVLSFRNAVVGRLGRSSEFSKEQLYNRDSYSQEYFE